EDTSFFKIFVEAPDFRRGDHLVNCNRRNYFIADPHADKSRLGCSPSFGLISGSIPEPTLKTRGQFFHDWLFLNSLVAGPSVVIANTFGCLLQREFAISSFLIRLVLF